MLYKAFKPIAQVLLSRWHDLPSIPDRLATAELMAHLAAELGGAMKNDSATKDSEATYERHRGFLI